MFPKIKKWRGRWQFQWFRKGRLHYGTDSLRRWLTYPIRVIRGKV